MEPAASYAVVADARTRELGVRVLIGLFIAGSAFLLAPGLYPPMWFATMGTLQVIDSYIASHVARFTDRGPANQTKALYIASTAINSIVYAAIAPYFWFYGGDAGQWYAILYSCGAMLHVCLRSYPSPWTLLAGAVPHASVLFAMPLIFTLQIGDKQVLHAGIVLVGGLIYMAHLLAGVRQAKDGLANLRAANAEANAARDLAERASAAKTDFLATVSHEIRTPMNAVLSAAHLLKRTTLTAEQEEHVAMLTNGGEVLVGLLNDVLDISKIEAGKMELEESELDLIEALDGLLKLYHPRVVASGVSLVLDGGENLPSTVMTDPLRVRQILFNLLSNAVKFTAQGQITLRAGRRLGTQSAGAAEWLWFEVEDTGCGIEPEVMGRLFGSFEQGAAMTARSHGGTGLGLAISRRLAELLGGSLTCESIPGKGSTFRFETPLVEAAPLRRVATEPPANDPGQIRPMSILVAEDHDVNRRIVSLFLEPLGWRLTMAVNGADAVEAARREPFDAILMDMQMPVLNGVDAACAIRAGGGPNAATPIIALTANALSHHREAWDVVGVAAFLTKPIDPDLLVSTLVAAGEARNVAHAAVA